MAVDTQHPDYVAKVKTWAKMRATCAGQDAVHAAKETYLPALDGQTVAQYDAYRARALYLNATGRSVDAFLGLVFRKPPAVDVPAGLAAWLPDITASGVSLEGMARLLLVELLAVGRFGLLVDYPERPEGTVTQTAAEMLGLRPRVKHYPAENVVNWRAESRNNRETLTLVVLAENVGAPEGGDEFDTATTELQYRVLDLEPGTGNYRQRVYRRPDKALDWVLTEEFYPQMGGKPMSSIPFILAGPEGERVTPEIPPLNDLADINLSHYRAYADYRHGLHFVGLPTAVVTGYSLDATKGETLSIGSASAWVFPSPDAKASFLEFQGQGLGALKEELDRLEAAMANFGARLLREVKRVAEAAETAEINRAGESSLLVSWAGVVAAALRKALEIMRDWSGFTGEVSVALNTDYMPTSMDAQTFTALLAGVQAGKISYETFWANLKRGEIAPDDRTAEDELGMIEAEGGGLGQVPGAGGGAGGENGSNL